MNSWGPKPMRLLRAAGAATLAIGLVAAAAPAAGAATAASAASAASAAPESAATVMQKEWPSYGADLANSRTVAGGLSRPRDGGERSGRSSPSPRDR